MTARVSNREKARLAVAQLEAEIAARRAAGETLPINGRVLHIGLICRTLGVSRSTAHQNPGFRAALEAYAAVEGLELPPTGRAETSVSGGKPSTREADLVPAARLREEQRRADAAERRVAELVARNATLSARLRRYEEADDMLLSSGRRHRPPKDAADLFAPDQHDASAREGLWK